MLEVHLSKIPLDKARKICEFLSSIEDSIPHQYTDVFNELTNDFEQLVQEYENEIIDRVGRIFKTYNIDIRDAQIYLSSLLDKKVLK